jgi:helix-turn-helix protein
MTQLERIIERLKTGEWLSSVEASRDMYIMRLGARIFDARTMGHHIIERRVEGKSYSEYKLIPPQVPVLPPAFSKPPEPQKESKTNQSLFSV